MDKITFSREKLYDLVWKEPITTLAKKHNILDRELRKACESLKVPLPRNGHWSKVKVGKEASREKLSSDYKGPTEISLDTVKEVVKVPSKIEVKPKDKKPNEIKGQSKSNITTPPHKLMVLTKKLFQERFSNNSRYTGTVSSAYDGGLDISVSKSCLDRALALMDTLINSLVSRGYNVETTSRETYISVAGEKIRLLLREKLKRIPSTDKWSTYEYVPSGSMYLKVDKHPDVEFREGQLTLENQLPKIIATIETKAMESRERRIKHEEWQAEQNEKRRLAKLYQQRQEKELTDFQTLFQDSNRWHKTTILRDYVNQVETRAIDNNTLSKDMQEWIAWARRKIDWYDPFLNAEDELLQNVDKENLSLKKANTSYWY